MKKANSKPHYIFLLLAVLPLFTIFGPNGWIQWHVAQIESRKSKKKIQNYQKEISTLKKEISRFKRSRTIQLRYVRENLGFLAKDEASIEFLNSTSLR